MPNKNYVSGRNFEYKVRDYLVSKGYLVIRSAGSKGVADLVAIKKIEHHNTLSRPTGIESILRPHIIHRPILIQCKHGHSKFIGYDKVVKEILNKHDVRFIHAFNGKHDIIFDEYCADLGKNIIIQTVEL